MKKFEISFIRLNQRVRMKNFFMWGQGKTVPDLTSHLLWLEY